MCDHFRPGGEDDPSLALVKVIIQRTDPQTN
jgi:hypothetical protein